MDVKINRFFERAGQFLFFKIRFPFFLLLLVFFPLSATLALWMNQQHMETLRERTLGALRQGKSAYAHKQKKEAFFQRYQHSNPYFLDQTLESLPFLTEETERLKRWMAHPALAEKQAIEKRIQFLEGEHNRLSFAESEIHSAGSVKETLEMQKGSIEVDTRDLKHLLRVIEDGVVAGEAPTARPQLLISQFKLRKKTTSLDAQVFDINMHLVKREFE